MKKLAALLLLAFSCCLQAAAQSDKVVVIEGKPKLDAQRSLGMKINYQTASGTNHTNLQAKIDANDGAAYPITFAGPQVFDDSVEDFAQNMPFHINKGLLLPEDTGRQFDGEGRHLASSENGTLRSSWLCLRAETYKTTFNGTSVKLTSSGAGTSITFTGYALTAADRYGTIHITGGTNASAGYYGFESVDTGTNTAVLDRSWCSGAVNNGAGEYIPAMVTDLGAGRVWNNLGLSFRQLPEDDTKNGIVVYHVVTSYAPDDRRSTGYQTMNGDTFAFGEVGILNGRYLNHTDPWDMETLASSWTGYSDDQSDNLRTDNCIFWGNKSAIYSNSRLSLIHHHTNMRVFNLTDSVFCFTAGGKLGAQGIEINGTSGRQCLLRLGHWAYENNSGMFDIDDVSFDGNTSQPQLFYARSSDKTGFVNVTIGHCSVYSNSPEDDLPRVDCDGKSHVHLTHIQGWSSGHGIPAGSLLLQSNSAGAEPVVTIDHSHLGDADAADLLHASSDSGARVILGLGNYLGDGSLVTPATYTKP